MASLILSAILAILSALPWADIIKEIIEFFSRNRKDPRVLKWLGEMLVASRAARKAGADKPLRECLDKLRGEAGA